jgi:hypothetical protein
MRLRILQHEVGFNPVEDLTVRVTRLGKFFTIRRVFTFSKITEAAEILATFFNVKRYVLISTKNGLGHISAISSSGRPACNKMYAFSSGA